MYLDRILMGFVISLLSSLVLCGLVIGCNYIYEKDIVEIPIFISLLLGYTYIIKK